MKTAVGVLALAGLAVGVVLLWPTAVPNDLVLGDIDESAVFGAELVERAERYERFLYVLWVLSQIALLATLWIYARKGAAYTKESAAGPIGTGMLLGMLGLAIVWLVNLPFRLVGHWWALRYDITDADYVTWLLEDWTLLGAQFVSVCLALLIVMGLARGLGDNWCLRAPPSSSGLPRSSPSSRRTSTTRPSRSATRISSRPPTASRARSASRTSPSTSRR